MKLRHYTALAFIALAQAGMLAAQSTPVNKQATTSATTTPNTSASTGAADAGRPELRSSIVRLSSTQSISVQYGGGAYGAPFLFGAAAPEGTVSWKLSVAENTGHVIFTDSGAAWKGNYSWDPEQNVLLQSGIFYIATVSFLSAGDEVLATEAIKFFTKPHIRDNRTPLIFFEGNTVEYDERLYNKDDGGVSSILDFIAQQANGPYVGSSVLVRGHAAFVTNTVEARKQEQYQLLRLSNFRAIKIIQELTDRGVDPRRVSYEVLGGSEEITDDPDRRWINRRVEVIFMSPSRAVSPEVQRMRMQYDDFKNDIKENPQLLQQQQQQNMQQNGVSPAATDPNAAPNASASRAPSPQDTLAPPASAADANAAATRGPSDNISSDPKAPLIDAVKPPATTATTGQTSPQDTAASAANGFSPEYSTITVPLRSDTAVTPWADTPVLSKGRLTVNEMTAFVIYNAPALNADYVRRIASYYVLEASREQINQDVAFAQMLLETNYLQFTGTVQKTQYNFAGIGTVDNNTEGNWFSTEQVGVRAHVQHLKGYATTQPLASDLVDPRYPLLERFGLLGTAPMVSTLSGRWAGDPEYGTKILRIMRRMYDFANAWNTVGTVN